MPRHFILHFNICVIYYLRKIKFYQKCVVFVRYCQTTGWSKKRTPILFLGCPLFWITLYSRPNVADYYSRLSVVFLQYFNGICVHIRFK